MEKQKVIAEELKDFVYSNSINKIIRDNNNQTTKVVQKIIDTDEKINFYGYYSDYDWVLFCSLYGKMIELPSNFPMYCRDLKQMAVDIEEKMGKDTKYKKNENAHNALADARWIKSFHTFLKILS